MAIYNYKCDNCGKIFEISASFNSVIGLKPECPYCQYPITHRIFSPPNVIYKSDGFYITDSRKKKDKKEE